MADPALTQVIGALKGLLDPLTGVNVFADRSDDEPVQETELPAIVIRAVDVSFEEQMEENSGALDHAATIDIDFYVGSDTADNMSFEHNQMMADGWALIAADKTLGGKVVWLRPMSISARADDVPAVGVAILTLGAMFRTSYDDWTEIP